jgi:hypothetical protein
MCQQLTLAACLCLLQHKTHTGLQVIRMVNVRKCATYQSIADELTLEVFKQKKYKAESECQGEDGHATIAARVCEDDGDKNIRRRVYDSLNVMKALGVVLPLKQLTGFSAKEVQWVGLPSSIQDVATTPAMHDEVRRSMQCLHEMHDRMKVTNPASKKASKYFRALCSWVETE